MAQTGTGPAPYPSELSESRNGTSVAQRLTMRQLIPAVLVVAVGAAACGGTAGYTGAGGSGGSGGAAGTGGGGGADGSGGAAGSGGSGGTTGTSGEGGGQALSQELAWSVSAQANALGNNLEIAVDNLYGFETGGEVPLPALTSLAKTLASTLVALSDGVCAKDPKAGVAAKDVDAVLSFIQSLPPGGGPATELNAQAKKEEGLTAALRSSIATSPCVNALAQANGATSTRSGTDISSETSLRNLAATDVEIPLHAKAAFPAVVIENLGGYGVTIASLQLRYADGTKQTIGFGSTQTDGSTATLDLSAQLAEKTSLFVDVDDRALDSVTLVGASVACPLPGSGGAGDGPTTCSTSLKIIGMAEGNGLSP
jgi:hypothetical protein